MMYGLDMTMEMGLSPRQKMLQRMEEQQQIRIEISNDLLDIVQITEAYKEEPEKLVKEYVGKVYGDLEDYVKDHISVSARRALAYHDGQIRNRGEIFAAHPLHTMAVLHKYLHAMPAVVRAGAYHDTKENSRKDIDRIVADFYYHDEDPGQLDPRVTVLTPPEKGSKEYRKLRSSFNILSYGIRYDCAVCAVKAAERVNNLLTIDSMPYRSIKATLQDTIDTTLFMALVTDLSHRDKELQLTRYIVGLVRDAQKRNDIPVQTRWRLAEKEKQGILKLAAQYGRMEYMR